MNLAIAAARLRLAGYPAARDCAARAALAAAMCLASECSQRSCYKSRTFGHNPGGVGVVGG